MISHSKRFIFVHIPKTAGTSMASLLGPHGRFLQGERNFDSIYFKHATALDLQRMMGDEFGQYFKFSVVRNPWDWAVSSYAFNRGLHRPLTRKTSGRYAVSGRIPEWAAGWDFKSWLRWWIDTFSPKQAEMLTDESGRLLVDRVIRFEELAREVPRLCWRLRIWPRLLPEVNRTQGRGKYADYYDAESRQWVADHFAEDIERFQYCFEGPLPGWSGSVGPRTNSQSSGHPRPTVLAPVRDLRA